MEPVLGLTLFGACVAEYLFNSVITCGVVNLATDKIGEMNRKMLAKQMIGRNHDIQGAMDTAFQLAVKHIFKEAKVWNPGTIPETNDEIKAKGCYDSLLKKGSAVEVVT